MFNSGNWTEPAGKKKIILLLIQCTCTCVYCITMYTFTCKGRLPLSDRYYAYMYNNAKLEIKVYAANVCTLLARPFVILVCSDYRENSFHIRVYSLSGCQDNESSTSGQTSAHCCFVFTSSCQVSQATLAS